MRQSCSRLTVSALAWTSALIPLPDNLPLEQAAPILCAGVTVWRALKDSGAKPHDWVAVAGGGGGLGSLAVQYGKYLGLNVVVIDTGDAKREMCSKIGAAKFVDYATSKDVVAE